MDDLRVPRRVLLVEDDADQRHLIAWMLRAEGCDVLEAETGIELLDWIAVATSAPDTRNASTRSCRTSTCRT